MRFRFITLSLHLAALLAFAVLPSCDKDPLNNGTTSSGETGSGGNNGGNSGENDGGNSGSGYDHSRCRQQKYASLYPAVHWMASS